MMRLQIINAQEKYINKVKNLFVQYKILSSKVNSIPESFQLMRVVSSLFFLSKLFVFLNFL